MEIIEITDKLINKIAKAEFEKQFDKLLTDKPFYIQQNWKEGAIEMLENYNRVVEILTNDV